MMHTWERLLIYDITALLKENVAMGGTDKAVSVTGLVNDGLFLISCSLVVEDKTLLCPQSLGCCRAGPMLLGWGE